MRPAHALTERGPRYLGVETKSGSTGRMCAADVQDMSLLFYWLNYGAVNWGVVDSFKWVSEPTHSYRQGPSVEG